MPLERLSALQPRPGCRKDEKAATSYAPWVASRTRSVPAPASLACCVLGFGISTGTMRSARASLVALASLASCVCSIALSDIDYLFAFGDSYTGNHYNPALGMSEVVGQDLWTSTGGQNWF